LVNLTYFLNASYKTEKPRRKTRPSCETGSRRTMLAINRSECFIPRKFFLGTQSENFNDRAFFYLL